MIENIEMYIFIFFVYSFAGWCMESFGSILNPNVKKFVNRGFMIGPYCPVYGIGVVLVTLLLNKYSNDIPALFFLSILICGSLEYFTSYIMEKLFNARWWDYHNKKFNINGRICLETLLPFGIAATIILCKINPFLINLFRNIPALVIQIITGVLSISFIVDFIISFKIILSFKGETVYKEKDSTEEIGEKVKDKAEDVFMKAESDIRYYSRKYKLKIIRKTRYTRNRLSEVIVETPKELAARINDSRTRFKNRIEEEKEKFNSQVQLKRTEFELRQKETKQLLDSEVKKTKNEFEKIQKNSKEKLDATIKNLKISSDEFSKQVIEKFRNKSLLRRRLMSAFPTLQVMGKNEKLNKGENKKGEKEINSK